MSLLFGNLTRDFVNFATVVALAQGGDQEAAAQIPAVAASFRRVASLDASYLTYIGKHCLHRTRLFVYAD
jgi:ATP-binding cassette subfamily B (MDR/TAP) protein 1